MDSRVIKVAPSTSKNAKAKPKPLVPVTIQQLRRLIICEAMFGVHRVYLLECSRPLKVMSYMLSMLMSLIISLAAFNARSSSVIVMVMKQAFLYGYIVLVFVSLVASKKKLKKFFYVLQEFDKKMNISDHSFPVYSSRRVGYCTLAIVVLNMMLFSTLIIHFHTLQSYMNTTGIFSVCTVYDLEQAFFIFLLRLVYTRLVVLKRLVISLFNVDTTLNTGKVNRIAVLFKENNNEISYLHSMYALLNEASVLLNSVMSIPMLILFATVGTNLIAMSNMFVAKLINGHYIDNAPIFLSYIVLRCVKSSLLLVVPCCYCSWTASEVNGIRAALNDALYIVPMDKIERRKVKTFIKLTRSCGFSYALCKVLRLDTTLLLKYASLCITYLVIIVQFSKIIS